MTLFQVIAITLPSIVISLFILVVWGRAIALKDQEKQFGDWQ